MDKSQNEEVSQSGEAFDSDPYSLFIFALNSSETKVKYISRLMNSLSYKGI
jgi:hypothetical protein